MSNIDRFLICMQHYAARDIDRIAALFADEITLRDWNISVTGKTAVVAETARNFAAAQTITIEPLALYSGAQSVAGELHIVVDGTLDLYVVDVLTFNADGQISAIRAYKGRGD